MAKWYGNVGFAVESGEIRPGVWSDPIVERPYYGDEIRNTRKLQANSVSINDNINISNSISIVADPYANENMYAIRYAEFQGARWKVTDIEVQRPRLILSLGGVWNGE